jgi:hypothetical protein
VIPTQETEHVAKALALLTDQFRDKARIQGLVGSIVAPLQDLEDVAFDVLAALRLDTAVGYWLDRLGAIAGERRKGRGDDEYRAAIRLRIRINRSEGTAEDLIDVARLAFPTAFRRTYREGYPASFEIEALDVEPSEVTPGADALRRTRDGGVQGTLIFTTWPFDPGHGTFTWDRPPSTDGPDAPLGNGFASVTDIAGGESGGLLSSVRVL